MNVIVMKFHNRARSRGENERRTKPRAKALWLEEGVKGSIFRPAGSASLCFRKACTLQKAVLVLASGISCRRAEDYYLY
jgi:hypothetical protein